MLEDSRSHALTTHCALCSSPAAEIHLWERGGEWFLRFAGLCGMSFSDPGPTERGDPICTERAQAVYEAFRGPAFDVAKIDAAGFYDDAGFCRHCERFYCAHHWNVSSTGGGTCPAGHFKSLDPHWHPAWGEL